MRKFSLAGITCILIVFQLLEIVVAKLFASERTELQQQWEIKITSQMAGAPFQSSLPPPVWAIAFSPDGKHLIIGTEFVQKDDFKSYLLIVAADHPTKVLRRFEIPHRMANRIHPRLNLSADGRFVVLSPYASRGLERSALLNLETGEVQIIASEGCRILGILPGPIVLQVCGSNIQLLEGHSTIIRQWALHSSFDVAFSPAASTLAIYRNSTRLKNGHPLFDEVAIMDARTGDVSQHWPLATLKPEWEWLPGVFADSGRSFCAMVGPTDPPVTRELHCWNVSTGRETVNMLLPKGDIRLESGGTENRIAMVHNKVSPIPFFLRRLAETSWTETSPEWWVWDIKQGSLTAQLPIVGQKVLPGNLKDYYVYSLSPDGGAILKAGSGSIIMYRIGSSLDQ